MTGHVIHLNTEIDAPPQVVWEVLTDLADAARILRSVKSVESVSEGPYGTGTTWREHRSIFGHHGAEELHVTEADPPRRTIHETQLGHDRIRIAYSLQTHDEHHTKLLLTANVDTRERNRAENLIWHIWGGFGFAATRRMLEHDLEDLRAEAELRSGGRQAGADSSGERPAS